MVITEPGNTFHTTTTTLYVHLFPIGQYRFVRALHGLSSFSHIFSFAIFAFNRILHASISTHIFKIFHSLSSDSLQCLTKAHQRYCRLEVDLPYYPIHYFRKRMGLLPPVSASGSEMQVGTGIWGGGACMGFSKSDGVWRGGF
jgi:hypothetical protein